MTDSISTLSSTFTTLINSLMTIERQPLTALTTKKDTISVQQGVYSDLNTMLTDFQGAVKSLISTDASYSFKAQRKVNVTGVATGSTVLSASASSSAVPAQYNVSVTSLAREHRVSSDRQVYYDQALNFSGSFWLGGTGTSSATLISGIENTLTASSTGSVESGQRELGNGTYSVETRKNSSNIWQFRLVDASGQAVSIKNSSGSYTTDWQEIPTSDPTNYDTGRGIKLSFGTDPNLYTAASKGAGASQIAYQSKGTQINVDGEDTLVDIAYAINSAAYAQDEDVVATILDNQLILARKSAGSGKNLTASDTNGILTQLGILSGGTFKHLQQAPADAIFSVNNIQVTRSKNTGLTDVIQGVTLNLASDAEGKTATVDVKYDSTSEKSVLNTFMSKFNSVISYLGAKVATVKQSDGTYKRGALAGDTMFQSLRMDLIRDVTASTVNSGIYKNLRDIGISLSDNFSLSVTDSSLLEKALSENKTGVTALIDSVMNKLQTKLSKYLGTGGYVTTASKALSTELSQTNDQITAMNQRLSAKEKSLRSRYGEIQAQLELMNYQQQQLSAIYNTLDQYS